MLLSEFKERRENVERKCVGFKEKNKKQKARMIHVSQPVIKKYYNLFYCIFGTRPKYIMSLFKVVDDPFPFFKRLLLQAQAPLLLLLRQPALPAVPIPHDHQGHEDLEQEP